MSLIRTKIKLPVFKWRYGFMWMVHVSNSYATTQWVTPIFAWTRGGAERQALRRAYRPDWKEEWNKWAATAKLWDS